VKLFYATAIVRLHIAQLAENATARRALARLRIGATGKVAQPIDVAAPSAFKYRGERLKSDQRRIPDHVLASIVLLTRVGKSAPKRVVRPLKQQVRNRVEYGIMVNRLLLYLNPADLAKAVLVMLKDRTGEKLVHDLRLSARKRHYTFSVLNHWRSR